MTIPQEDDRGNEGTHSEATAPDNAAVSGKYNFYGGIEAAIFASVFLSALFTSIFAVRTITALPMTLVLDEAWKAISQRRLPDLRDADILGTAGAYLRTSLTGLATVCTASCTCVGIVVGVGAAFRSRRVQNVLADSDNADRRNCLKQKYNPSNLHYYTLGLCAGAMAATELGVGVIALRWWYGEDLNEVMREWPRSVTCSVVGGLVTAALQCWRASSKRSKVRPDEAALGPSESGPSGDDLVPSDCKV